MVLDTPLRARRPEAVGLSDAQAAERRLRYGTNHLAGHRPYRTARNVLRQFSSPIIWLLAAATGISMALGDVIDGAIILAIILASTAIGFWQEHQAGLAMERLARQLQIHVEVMRDGSACSVPLDDVVIDDVVLLHAGDLIPADMRLDTANTLLVDEATLTGESELIEKAPGDGAPGMLWQGTHVVSGSGSGTCTAIGSGTRYGQIAAALDRATPRNSFEQGTRAFGRMLMWTTGLLAVVLLAINLSLGRGWVEAAMFSLALAVGLTPQMLPAIVAVSLSAGARRLAKAAVLVRRPDAIAELGAMTELCCDKTGTLTQGSVRLTATLDPQGRTSSWVLLLGYTNAALQAGFANPVDEAILLASPSRPVPELRQELPYDFERRLLTVVCSDREGSWAITKGAFASVLSRSSHVRVDGASAAIGPHVDAIRRAFAELSIKGLRVLAIATRPWSSDEPMSTDDEADLIFEGLLAFEDPMKADAREAVTALADLGITVRLVTGDNALAARHAAEAVGIPASRILTGSQVATLPDSALLAAVSDCRVFAEVDPMGKQRLVHALRARGCAVGVLGDGINDTAALHSADVGISVETAVDCARQAAAIVLLDKDLHVLANGVRTGRQTFANTLKYVHVTISANFGNMLSMVVATAFLPFLPLLPVQILLLNFLSDIPALLISTDSVDEEDIQRPTSWNIAHIRRFMITFGCISSVADLTLFFVLERLLHQTAPEFQSSWFVASTLTELAALLVLRTRRPAWRSRPSRALLLASVLVAIITVTLPFTDLGRLVGMVPLAPLALVSVLFVTLGSIGANEMAKAYRSGMWLRRRG